VKPDSIVVAIPTEIAGKNVDPTYTTGGFFLQFLFNVYDGLYRFDRSGNPKPSLATADTVSPDGLTHTLTIRSGAQFHDGSALSAEDVKFSLDRARGVDPANPNPPSKSYLAAIARVEVTNPTTVVLGLKFADPILQNELAYQTGLILPKAYLTRVGNEGFWQKPVGSGPYSMVESVAGQHIKLKAFDQYWGTPKPQIKNVTLKIVPDPASRIAQLQAGDADFVIDADPSQVDSLKKGGYKVMSNAGGDLLWVSFDQKKGKLADPRVGQALNLAVNREAIIKQVYLGYGRPIASLDTSTATIDPNLKPYPYDPNKAKQLLTDAGYDFSSVLEIVQPVGRYLKSDDALQAIVSDLQKIGVKAKATSRDYNTWLADYKARKSGTTFTNSANNTFDTVVVMSSILACNGTFSLWCEPNLEQRFGDLRTASGADRVQKIRELDRYVHDNPPGIFLLGLDQVDAMKSSVGWTPTPGTRVIFLTDLQYR
jgi:peptide/nickel transport system substrate-binding protein